MITKSWAVGYLVHNRIDSFHRTAMFLGNLKNTCKWKIQGTSHLISVAWWKLDLRIFRTNPRATDGSSGEREKKANFFVFFPRFFLCLCLPVSVCLSVSLSTFVVFNPFFFLLRLLLFTFMVFTCLFSFPCSLYLSASTFPCPFSRVHAFSSFVILKQTSRETQEEIKTQKTNNAKDNSTVGQTTDA